MREPSDRPDEGSRHETGIEQLDRNWADLLQELRVAQTGVQLLTGFLLTLPFQERFATLSDFQEDVYLVTVATSIASVAFLIAPVSLHRMLFRRYARRVTVAAAHRLAVVGLLLLGCAIVEVTLLIFDVVRGRGPAIAAAAVAVVLLLSLWLAIPGYLRGERDRGD